MKHILLSATALALILSIPAFAADPDHDNHHGHGGTPATATGGGGTHAHGAGHATTPAGTATGGAGSGRHHGGTGGTATTNNPITGGGTMGGTHHHGGTNNGGTATGGAAIFGIGGHGRNAGNATHAGRGHNSAFDAFRRNVTASRHFHFGSTYHRPQGWYAHRWTFGEFLPSFFFARNYWISDYSEFDLPDPPEGCTWVRYGDDALLVDEDTGEVIQVVYGIFY